ncbi:caspase family protein [Rhodospirillaceae bacterium SYSU D60014]|uniref:caspase family protein n=1 Tax=Virgifigura deserti TaxID=2268457 RepID=UPI000E66262B
MRLLRALPCLGRAIAFSALATGLLLLASGGRAAVAGDDLAGDERVALVIGNGAYESLDTLPEAVADAAAVADALRGLEFEVIELFNGSNGEMSAHLQTFSQRLKPGTVALFYYSGRSVQFQGRNFLLPASANLASDFAVLTEGIVADAVINVMQKSGAALNLLFLDAAHRNRFAEGSETLAPGLVEIASERPETIIVLAAEPGRVIDDANGDGSRFADALVTGLSRPVVEVNRLLAELQARVSTTTAGDQRPWISVTDVDEVYLRAPELSPAESTVVQTEPEPESQDSTAITDPVKAAAEAVASSAVDSEAFALPGQEPAVEPQDQTIEAPTDSGDATPETTVAAATDAAAEAPAEPTATQPATQPAGRFAELQAIEDALGAKDKERIQAWLARKGYYKRTVDGVFGPGTRQAIRAYQEAAGAEPTGWLTVAQLYRILRDS